MRRLLLALALLLGLAPGLSAQLSVPGGSGQWFDSLQDVSVTGFFGINIPNEAATGTTDTLLACYTTAGTAITCAVGTALEVLGPVQRGGGTTGSATIANTGLASSCQFDGATTVGHYVQLSTTTAGNCHDAGATMPADGRRVIGTVTSTNGAAGVYPVFMFSRGTLGLEAGLGPVDIQTFAADGTWTKPSAASTVYVFACGPGGSGGGGEGAAASTLRTGGGGGGGGFCKSVTFRASELTATVAVTAPAGPAGGAGGVSAAGADGTAGGSTTFGSYITVRGGGGGAGNTPGAAGGGGGGCTSAGINATTTAGVAGGGCFAAGPGAGTVSQDGSVGASSTTTGSGGTNGNCSSFGAGAGAGSSTTAGGIASNYGGCSLVSGGGGGAGGGVDAANGVTTGSQGGLTGPSAAPGLAGVGTGTSGAACGSGGVGQVGLAATSGYGGGGGSGGSGQTGGTGCAGGAGGVGGGGGAGGAGGTSTGGAGGAGGSGWVVVISWASTTGGGMNAIGNITGTATVNWTAAPTQTATLTGNTTLSFANPVAGTVYYLILTQGGAGSFTVTWPTVKWSAGAAPVLTTTAGKIDIVSFLYDGTNYYGQAARNY